MLNGEKKASGQSSAAGNTGRHETHPSCCIQSHYISQDGFTDQRKTHFLLSVLLNRAVQSVDSIETINQSSKTDSLCSYQTQTVGISLADGQ